MSFSHLDENDNPNMVDVSNKSVTQREAVARAKIFIPSAVMPFLKENNFTTKKGAVFQTAILAGIMGVKKTADLIPLCHILPIEKCDIQIYVQGENEIWIDCSVKVSGKTGVEMEALTGATVSALTIYDMCKALSQEMVIKEIYLLSKTGGKSSYSSK
ncbi:MAG: cyclic pyranopterin monophosphate synthase MoaC [Bacteroidetes bacterium]|nr:cyclic pyranopterin monophosphate synthase MoaC [Bacteroidota bacterium]